MACPATGFAVGIERILLARDMQNISDNVRDKNIFISYSDDDKIDSAIKKALELRNSGKIVEIALSAQSKTDADKFRLEKGYSEMIYLA